MSTKTSDFAIGAVVILLAVAGTAYVFMRGDDCLDKARGFVRTAPAVTAKAGKILSVGTSTWLSGQAASKPGERSFYFLLKGERATANAIVSTDHADCTCRLESITRLRGGIRLRDALSAGGGRYPQAAEVGVLAAAKS